MPGCEPQQSIIRGQEYLNVAGFRACEIERIDGAETQLRKLPCPLDMPRFELHPILHRPSQEANTGLSLSIGRARDLEVHNLAAGPLPLTRLHMRENEQHCFRFKADAILCLIIIRPVQAAHVQVDAGHRPYAPNEHPTSRHGGEFSASSVSPLYARLPKTISGKIRRVELRDRERAAKAGGAPR